MTSDITKSAAALPADEAAEGLFDNWFDPIESALRDRVRGFIEDLIQDELEGVLARPRYGRRAQAADGVTGTVGHRHGSRSRTLTGTFGKSEITV
ncbi:MAG: IS256 family transposase, partial [Bradyrhizobiaceae bacterium]